MQTENKFIDDLSKVASSALGVVSGLRDEAESALRARMERLLSNMDLVTREDFEVVRDMAVKAREENEALKKRLEALEAKSSAPKTTAKPKTTRAKTTKTAKPKA